LASQAAFIAHHPTRRDVSVAANALRPRRIRHVLAALVHVFVYRDKVTPYRLVSKNAGSR